MDCECTLFEKFPAAIFKTVYGIRFPKSRLQTFPKDRPLITKTTLKIFGAGEKDNKFIYKRNISRNCSKQGPQIDPVNTQALNPEYNC